MDKSTHLIGYDIRREPASCASTWDSERREAYLIRPDVACPLSIDTSVWPSRFQVGSTDSEDYDSKTDTILVDPVRGNTHFILFHLWSDLDEMLSFFRPSPVTDRGIAVAMLNPDAYPKEAKVDQGEWWRAIHGTPINPEDSKHDWLPVGYEVCDSGPTSLLSNFGLPSPEHHQRRKRWESEINDHGLLRSREAALEFYVEAGKRFSVEGPFYIFQIFLIW